MSSEIPTNAIQITKKTEEQPKIIIVGDQSCRDLASSLIKLRAKHRNAKDYDITCETYPNASLNYIVQKSKAIEYTLNKEDWLILSAGANDINPTKFLIEVSSLLKKLNEPKIIVSGVRYNPHLNEDKLNRNLKTISNSFENCQYLPTANDRSINHLINVSDYKNCYLDSNITRMSKIKTKPILASAKYKFKNLPGTIPYYFKKQELNLQKCVSSPIAKPNCSSWNINHVGIAANKPKPGTIPFYFKQLPKCSPTHKNISKLVTSTPQFFRS